MEKIIDQINEQLGMIDQNLVDINQKLDEIEDVISDIYMERAK